MKLLVGLYLLRFKDPGGSGGDLPLAGGGDSCHGPRHGMGHCNATSQQWQDLTWLEPLFDLCV